MLRISFEVLCLMLGLGRLVAGGTNCSKKCISGAPPSTLIEPDSDMTTFLPGVDDIYNEVPCALQGGMCVTKSDCPSKKLAAIKGLCPTQQTKNVECCYGISIKDKRCKKHGGQCVAGESGCSRVVDRTKINDCAPGEICCILT